MLVYSFLNWVFVIQLKSISVHEDIVNLWVPLFLPLIPILIWVRPRLRLLQLKTGSRDFLLFYTFAASIVMGTPVSVAQHYLVTATGKMTHLKHIGEIDKHEETKYYTVKSCFIDKAHGSAYASFDVSGKHNQDFNMHLYVVYPMLENAGHVMDSTCKAAIGFTWRKTIKNSLSDAAKDQEYGQFARECQAEIDSRQLDVFEYLDRVGNSADGDGLMEAFRRNDKYRNNNVSLFYAVCEPFENHNGHKLPWIFYSFLIAHAVWLIMLVAVKLSKYQLSFFESGKGTEDRDLKEFIGYFKPVKDYTITPILIYINLLFALLVCFSGGGFMYTDNEMLIKWGANYEPLVEQGQYWRLLTAAFLHGGLLHLFMNMAFLIVGGTVLEPLLGKFKFLMVYLLLAILASCCSLWWYDPVLSVGASGAVFGLFGVLIVFAMAGITGPENSREILFGIVLFIAYNLLLGLATKGIDNAGHIGGLLAGIAIGVILAIPKTPLTVKYRKADWED